MRNFIKIGFIGLVLLNLTLPVLAVGDSDFNENQQPVSVDVYPNPVLGDEFTISSDAEISGVKILNILGQQVFEQNFIGGTKINIELEIKEKGIYLVQVKTFDGRVTTKRILFK